MQHIITDCHCIFQAELEALDSDNDSHSSAPARSQRDQSQSGGTTVLNTLEERLQMYQQARSNAMTSGDSSKARRLDRGLHVSLCCTHVHSSS